MYAVFDDQGNQLSKWYEYRRQAMIHCIEKGWAIRFKRLTYLLLGYNIQKKEEE